MSRRFSGWPALLPGWQRLTASTFLAFTIVGLAARQLHSVDPSTYTRVVLAPVPWIVGLVPPGPNLGTPENPAYHGTPLLIVAAWTAVMLCGIAYTGLLYALLTLVGRRGGQR